MPLQESLLSRLLDHAQAARGAVSRAQAAGQISPAAAHAIVTEVAAIEPLAVRAEAAARASITVARTGELPRDYVREYGRRLPGLDESAD